MGNYASGDQRAATVSFSKNCFLIILPATARILREPPGADPHAGWCGGWGGDPPGYPIVLYLFLRIFFHTNRPVKNITSNTMKPGKK